MICEKDYNIISVFDVFVKEKNYEMVKSNPDEVHCFTFLFFTL